MCYPTYQVLQVIVIFRASSPAGHLLTAEQFPLGHLLTADLIPE